MKLELAPLITGLLLAVCGSFVQANAINRPPVADANGPYSVTTTQYVITLDGSGSFDID